jgi:N-acetyl-alpha-D-muramate 1-phosphate uridylyltransferase
MADLKTAMLLAAGRGERLRPLTDHTPKPLLAVRGSPLLQHQLQWLARAGITDVVINLRHLGERIENFCGDGARFGLHIEYSRESQTLETGGGVRQALPLLGEAPFLILNGDIFTTFNLASLQDLPDWADIHLLLTPKPDYRERGDFNLADGHISSRGDDYVYCGIAILRPGIFSGVSPGAFSLRDLYFQAVATGRASAQVWDGYWIDIGGPEQLQAANTDDLSGTAGGGG